MDEKEIKERASELLEEIEAMIAIARTALAGIGEGMESDTGTG